jgi:hypothetical protein
MDRSLATLLRSLQTSPNYADAFRLLGPATSLLSSLTNPLNVTLLSSQLLTHRSFYPRPIELQNCRSIFSVFYTATSRLLLQNAQPPKDKLELRISNESWAKAVIKGADDGSPRWRHVLLLGAVLLGLGGRDQAHISSTLRAKIESALVMASNLALQEEDMEEPNSRSCVVFVLNHTMGSLSDFHRTQLNYDLFLPLAVDATFFSKEGLEHGYWLGMIDADVRQTVGQKFTWSQKSQTFLKVKNMKSKVLLFSLGSLARLIAHAIEYTTDSTLVLKTMERLTEFSRILLLSWRQNKLSEIDPAEENQYLDAEALQATRTALWPLLRDVMFALVIIERAALGRVLVDPVLASNLNAPLLAIQCLHILRNIHFISSREGATGFSPYRFVTFTAIDVLTQFPQTAEQFLQVIGPTDLGRIPQHPLDRNLDQFFMDTSEHFTLYVSPAANQDLLLAAATPYLAARGQTQLKDLYEAAHSIALAVFAAPQNTAVAIAQTPFYLDSLLNSFPSTLSPRQFRLAIKSVMRVTAPPSPIADAQPMLQSTILELLHERACRASTTPLSEHGGMQPSERTSLILAMMDSLPTLPVMTLEEWLPIISDLIHKSVDPAQLSTCQNRFWEVLSSGEMDVERAALCVTWWNSRGGRESLLFNEIPDDSDQFMMSGALPMDSKL